VLDFGDARGSGFGGAWEEPVVTDGIKGDDFFLSGETVMYLTVLADSLIIHSSEGYITVDCMRPRFVLRDYVADNRLDFASGGGPHDGVLGCGQVEAVFSKCQPRHHRAPPLADTVPVRDGWFVVELSARTDYHPWSSLQVIAITRSEHLILGFSGVTYRCTFPPDTDLRLVFLQITDGRQCGHCTVHPQEAFLNWVPTQRIYCERIDEIPDRPESLGGFISTADFSHLPEHAAFKSRTAKTIRPVGPDIDL
jgi:hypothetical protein